MDDQLATGNDALVEARDLSRYFDVSAPFLNRISEGKPRQVVRAVDGVSFAIKKGTTFSLVGESGCGKSTVARLMVGLYEPTGGTIVYDGVDLSTVHGRDARTIQGRMQMVFQDPYASLNPRWRVADIVAEPIRHGKTRSGTDVKDRVGALLRQVGLSEKDATKYPHEFSGGQRQRISIARALAGDPDFIVCDEPTSALDVSVQAQILNLMRKLQRELNLTYLFISHDLAVVYHISTEVAVMYLGRICERASTETLFAKPRHPYTRLLLDTIPDLDMTGAERQPVSGEVPSPINPPSGCAFHPRCPLANDRCRAEAPALLRADDALVACHAVEENRLPDRPATAPPGLE